MKYNYEKVMRCAARLGVMRTFSHKGLSALLKYADTDEESIRNLIRIMGEDAFTEEAKDLMEEME